MKKLTNIESRKTIKETEISKVNNCTCRENGFKCEKIHGHKTTTSLIFVCPTCCAKSPKKKREILQERKGK